MARPRIYSEERAAAVCARLADGESLLSISKRKEMPSLATMKTWVTNDIEGFSARYARARDAGLDVLADQIIEIADTPMIGTKSVSKATGLEITEGDMIEHRRLQVDARKWYLSKLAPKKYGDKQQVEHTGSLTLEQLVTGSFEGGKDAKE